MISQEHAEFEAVLALGRAKRMAKLKGDRRERYRHFSRETLWRMALLPRWTERLAREVLFVAPQASTINVELDTTEVQRELSEALKAQLVTSSEVPLGFGEKSEWLTIYFMPPEMRTRILQDFPDDDHSGAVQEVQADLGRKIIALDPTRPDVRPLWRWASLVAETSRRSDSPVDIAGFLDRQIDAILRRDDSSENQPLDRPSQALEWIETARPLVPLLDPSTAAQLTAAVHRAGRKLELCHRDEYDRSLLVRFLERRDQVNAYNDLINGSDNAWALHYIGVGGSGKTMLMRHISVNLAKQWAVARIDFDYLNADFPTLSPGLLLWSFGQELRAHDTERRASKAFDEADLLLRELSEALRSDANTATDLTARGIGDRRFHRAIELYLQAMRSLPRPVLLILDTCEELGKLRADGSVPENVEATFRILEALHDGPSRLAPTAPTTAGLPKLRVIFSGRRPLARGGYGGWTSGQSGLDQRSYLRLHEIRGFDERESYDYLINRAQTPSELVDAIIHRSRPEPGRVGIHRPGNPADTDASRRCNPLELARFAEWARQTPPPTADQIQNATDEQYIQHRILDRLTNRWIKSLLPVLVVIARFDRPMLQRLFDAVVTADETAGDFDAVQQFDAVFEEFRRQEWIFERGVATEDGSNRYVLEIQHGVRQRLLRYYGSYIATNELSLAADLHEALTLEQKLESMDWTHCDSTLRVLETIDPLRAAHWWKRLEARIFTERDFAWSLNWTDKLLGPGGVASASDEASTRVPSAIRAAVLATHAVAQLHSGKGTTVCAATWMEVEVAAKRFPDLVEAGYLHLRALAGQVTAVRLQGLDSEIELMSRFILAANELNANVPVEVATCLMSAFEAMVEAAESLPLAVLTARLLPLKGQIFDYAIILLFKHFAHLKPDTADDRSLAELSAAAHSLIGRIFRLGLPLPLGITLPLEIDFTPRIPGDPSTYEDSRRRVAVNSFEIAIQLPPGPPPRSWPDWVAPADLAARVRLEFIRGCYPASLSAEEMLAAVGDWPELPDTVDDNRLHSALLQLELAQSSVTGDRLQKLGELSTAASSLLETNSANQVVNPSTAKSGIDDSYKLFGEGKCNAHRKIQPLFATIAEVLASGGRVDLAMELPRRVLEGRSIDFDSRRAAERVCLRLVRRFRLRDEGEGLSPMILPTSEDLEDQTLLWALDGLDGLKNTRPLPEIPAFVSSTDRPTWLHAVWQTRFAKLGTGLGASSVLQWMTRQDGNTPDTSKDDTDDTFIPLMLRLDQCEALVETAPAGAEIKHSKSLAPIDAVSWWQSHPSEPEKALILALRVMAIQEVNIAPTLWKELRKRLGDRRALEIAQEQGELLALRLPDRGRRIFELALQWPTCDPYLSLIMAIEIGLLKPEPTGDERLRAMVKPLFFNPLPQDDGMIPIAGNLPQVEIENLTAGGFKPPNRSCWRPWLVRLQACLHGPQPRPSELWTWIDINYGVTSQDADTPLLPPDLDFFLHSGSETGPRKSNSRLDTRLNAEVTRQVLNTLYLSARLSKQPWFALLVGTVVLVLIFHKVAQRLATFVINNSEAEIALLLLGVVTTLSVALITAYNWSARKTSWFRMAVRLVVSFMSLFLLALDGVFVLFIFGYSERFETAHISISVGVIVMALPALIVMLHGKQYLKSKWAQKGWLRLQIMRLPHLPLPTSGYSSQTQALTVMAHSKYRLRLFAKPHFYDEFNQLEGLEISLTASTPYTDIVTKVPARQSRLMRKVTAGRGRYPAWLTIEPEEGFHGPCWEALAGLPRRGGFFWNWRLPRLRCRRHIASRGTASQTVVGPVRVVSWVPSGGQLFALQAWDAIKKNGFSSERSSAASIHGVDEAPDRVQILHLLGEPIEDSVGGTQWLVADEATGHLDEYKGTASEFTPANPEDIRRKFPNLRLCILQGKLEPRRHRRSAIERRDAMLARVFAAGLAVRGIDAVITLPPMEPDLANQVLRRLVQMINSRPRHGTAALGDAVVDVQRLILNSVSRGPLVNDGGTAIEPDELDAIAKETALDVCYYCGPDWDGSFPVVDPRSIPYVA